MYLLLLTLVWHGKNISSCHFIPPQSSPPKFSYGNDGMTSSSPSPSKFGPENNSVGRHLPVWALELKLVPKLQNEKLVRDQEKSGQKSVKTSNNTKCNHKVLVIFEAAAKLWTQFRNFFFRIFFLKSPLKGSEKALKYKY